MSVEHRVDESHCARAANGGRDRDIRDLRQFDHQAVARPRCPVSVSNTTDGAPVRASSSSAGPAHMRADRDGGARAPEVADFVRAWCRRRSSRSIRRWRRRRATGDVGQDDGIEAELPHQILDRVDVAGREMNAGENVDLAGRLGAANVGGQRVDQSPSPPWTSLPPTRQRNPASRRTPLRCPRVLRRGARGSGAGRRRNPRRAFRSAPWSRCR